MLTIVKAADGSILDQWTENTDDESEVKSKLEYTKSLAQNYADTQLHKEAFGGVSIVFGQKIPDFLRPYIKPISSKEAYRLARCAIGLPPAWTRAEIIKDLQRQNKSRGE